MTEHPAPAPASAELTADCANCFGLCCVALPFAASADFALDKRAGDPCTHLRTDFRCGIHTRLRDRGFSGCTVYECFGAGQKVSQATYGGRDWRRHPRGAREMFAVYPVMRQLHELLRYLTEALALAPADGPLRGALRGALDRTDGLTRGTPAELLELDVTAVRDEVNPLLLETSERVRAAALPGRPRKDHRGADLFGARLRGGDLRDADLRGADLTGCLFLTRPQLDAASGDTATRLPPDLPRPAHWDG